MKLNRKYRFTYAVGLINDNLLFIQYLQNAEVTFTQKIHH